MARRVLVGDFATAADIQGATRAAREHGFHIADAYTPYPVCGMDRVMGLRPSRLPWACFVCGLVGASFAISSQYWAMAHSWPIDVGGKPWNSLPAYVPVTFEVMVLLAGYAVVVAFLLRCRLFPGKEAAPLFRGATDDTFVLALEQPEDAGDANVARQLFDEFHAVRTGEREV